MTRDKTVSDADIRMLAPNLISYDQETGDLRRIARQTRTRSIIPLDAPEPVGHMKDGYLRVSFYGKSFYAHRLAWLFTYGEWPEGEIDHINGDRKDNRIANLRSVDRTGNAQNVRRAKVTNPHGELGLNWHKAAGKWMGQISVGNKSKYLGLFETRADARAAYLEAKRGLHAFGTI